MKNLFSILFEEQMKLLTKEERDQLFSIDQKLFPDDNTGGGGENDWLNKRLKSMEDQRKEDERYANQLEKEFC
ncbi:MAG: hypothetical protein J6Q22_08785 [Prevotella sp.]|nr:hypothetical protein [Prevotella sp.]